MWPLKAPASRARGLLVWHGDITTLAHAGMIEFDGQEFQALDPLTSRMSVIQIWIGYETRPLANAQKVKPCSRILNKMPVLLARKFSLCTLTRRTRSSTFALTQTGARCSLCRLCSLSGLMTRIALRSALFGDPLQILEYADVAVARREFDLRPATAELPIHVIVPPAMIVEALQNVEIA